MRSEAALPAWGRRRPRAQLDFERRGKGWEVLPSCVAGVSSPRRDLARQSQVLSAGPFPDLRKSHTHFPRVTLDFSCISSLFPPRPARPKAATRPPLLRRPRLSIISSSGAQGGASGRSWAHGQSVAVCRKVPDSQRPEAQATNAEHFAA